METALQAVLALGLGWAGELAKVARFLAVSAQTAPFSFCLCQVMALHAVVVLLAVKGQLLLAVHVMRQLVHELLPEGVLCLTGVAKPLECLVAQQLAEGLAVGQAPVVTLLLLLPLALVLLHGLLHLNMHLVQLGAQLLALGMVVQVLGLLLVGLGVNPKLLGMCCQGSPHHHPQVHG
jgi:hypothetical protein